MAGRHRAPSTKSNCDKMLCTVAENHFQGKNRPSPYPVCTPYTTIFKLGQVTFAQDIYSSIHRQHKDIYIRFYRIKIASRQRNQHLKYQGNLKKSYKTSPDKQDRYRIKIEFVIEINVIQHQSLPGAISGIKKIVHYTIKICIFSKINLGARKEFLT